MEADRNGRRYRRIDIGSRILENLVRQFATVVGIGNQGGKFDRIVRIVKIERSRFSSQRLRTERGRICRSSAKVVGNVEMWLGEVKNGR